MHKIIPAKLLKGDMIRVVSLSLSLSLLRKEQIEIADKRFAEMGIKLTFGKHVREIDEFRSLSIASRIEDLHNAFSDPSVNAVIAVIGGWSANQLLSFINWDLLRKNPKIFCGYSDITVLTNAIFAKTGLITYSGPTYSTFGEKKYFDFTSAHFQKCLMDSDRILLEPSLEWSDDQWHLDQEERNLIHNEGYHVINEGNVNGTLLGGNLCTFNLLQGTPYLPDLSNSILFLEDDHETLPHTFDRDLQSLIHQPGFNGVKGIVFGRFQNASKMTNSLLEQIVTSKKELRNMPVISQIDFGHTSPMITFPIGGTVSIDTNHESATITILEH